MKKIIIDTDPGVDDTFAILLATKSSELNIEAITTVDGNCSLENATKNAFKILDLANRGDIPVYKGMCSSLNSKNVDASYAHGNNGMGGVSYQVIERKVEDESAVDYLVKTIRENPDQITIVAIGPLTNIACAINKDPKFASNVKSLIIMGGAIEHGNITPFAEFNFYKDATAAKIVFEANFKDIIMFGLDVTNKLPLTKKLENILQNSNNDLAKFLFDITRTGAEFDKNFGGFLMHDSVTIAYLVDHSIVKLKNAKINIETSGEKTGKSNVTFVEASNCKVAYDIEPDKFYSIVFKRLLDIDV